MTPTAALRALDKLRAKRKLMYAGSSVEQMLWLVWELQAGKPTLAVICTTDADLARYVSPDHKSWGNGSGAVFVEKVMADHLYGSNDARIAANILRNKRHQ